MFPKSLQWRLVSFFCLITFCLVIPIGLYLNGRIESKYYDNFRNRIEKGFEEWSVRDGSRSAEELKAALESSRDVFLLNLEQKLHHSRQKRRDLLHE